MGWESGREDLEGVGRSAYFWFKPCTCQHITSKNLTYLANSSNHEGGPRFSCSQRGRLGVIRENQGDVELEVLGRDCQVVVVEEPSLADAEFGINSRLLYIYILYNGGNFLIKQLCFRYLLGEIRLRGM